MKILQVNCVYNTGSTGKIMYDIHTEILKTGYESVVCYGRGANAQDKNVYKICSEIYSKFNNLLSRFTGIMYGGCFFSTNKLISVIKKENPDVVHLHCINGYFVNIYRLINWLKKNRIKTVLTLHAEFMHTANCGYAFDCEKWKSGCGNCPVFKKETKSLFFDSTARSFKKMKKAFDGFNENLVIASVSEWLMERAKQSPILAGKKHITVLNGLDNGVFNPCFSEALAKQIGTSDKKTVLFVTPAFSLDPNHIKGGYYVVELARRMPDVNFVIIGCREQYDNLPKNVLNIGRIENQSKLAEYYSTADVTLLASKRETFSMVTAESLSCGTPVVGFKAGAPETITIPEYSCFVEYGDIDALRKTVNEFLLKQFDREEIATEASQKYDKKIMSQNYITVYKKLVNLL